LYEKVIWRAQNDFQNHWKITISCFAHSTILYQLTDSTNFPGGLSQFWTGCNDVEWFSCGWTKYDI